ncbi:hypothetical protein C8Q76DRAFT_811362 [Earliella scabrosa]|nr:hypothetical protein C8Q76DRAFT_811362 [Earliella scabrosa]
MWQGTCGTSCGRRCMVRCAWVGSGRIYRDMSSARHVGCVVSFSPWNISCSVPLECTAVGQREAWALVREWARKRGLPEVPVSYGSVLGAPVLSLEHVTGKRSRAVDHFYQTVLLVSNGALDLVYAL